MPSKNRNNFGMVGMLTIGHAVNDAFSAMLAPLLPILMQTFAISTTQAGLLTFFLRGPSVIQPIIGNSADRKDLRWAVIIVPIMAALSISMIAVTQNYMFVIFLLLLAGFASATFHAIAPVIVGNLSNGQLGRYLGFFVVGGEMGRMLGPIIFVQAIALWAARGSVPWFILIGILGSVVVFIALRSHKTQSDTVVLESIPLKEILPSLTKVLIPFLVISLAQYLAIVAMTTFLPVFLVGKGETLANSVFMLAVLQVGGLVGAYFGGWLSDLIGRRVTILITIIGTTVFMLIFLLGKGWMTYPTLILFGMFGLSEGPVLIAIIQELFEKNKSMANGAFMGLNFAVQAISSLLVGIFMDQMTAQTAFIVCALIPLIGAPMLFFVPKTKPTKEPATT